jgi:site-specific DNA recombinase
MQNTAATYARYSTEEQDPRSIEDQVRRCAEKATILGYKVVAVFDDAAVSGGHTDRAGLQRLLEVTTAKGKRAPFHAVLVDDLSRLSRNMGDFWGIIDDLANVGIKVIDVQTGMSSDEPNARAMFGFKSLMNDQQRETIRYQTHRGLEGRAKSGFWTGGKVYGYRTRPENNPSDPKHTRMVPIVCAEEAEVVRRIFELFVDGAGLKSITNTLNRDRIPAPHDNGKGNKGARGWTHNTIRNVLRNERYIGRWTWNTTKWLGARGSKKRKRIAKPRSEWIVRECPDLVIIDLESWTIVHGKLKRHAAVEGKALRPGRPAGTGKQTYLVSGLLGCGVCGGKMSIIGGRVLKNGTRCVTYGCTTYYTRDKHVCGNALTISEKRITAALLESLRETFADPEVIARVTKSIAAKVQKVGKPVKATTTPAMIAEVEGRIRNLTEALAAMPASGALLEKLKDEELRLAELKAARRAGPVSQSIKAPSEAQVRTHLAALVGTMETDPVAGREVLAAIMSPVVLTPKTTPRGYECRAVFRSFESLGLSSGTEVSKKYGSGGRI